MANGSLMKVESIAECSPWSILRYFWPALSCHWSCKAILCLFESGRFTKGLLYLLYISSLMMHWEAFKSLCMLNYWMFHSNIIKGVILPKCYTPGPLSTSNNGCFWFQGGHGGGSIVACYWCWCLCAYGYIFGQSVVLQRCVLSIVWQWSRWGSKICCITLCVFTCARLYVLYVINVTSSFPMSNSGLWSGTLA